MWETLKIASIEKSSSPMNESHEVGQALEVARVSLLRVQTTLHQYEQVADERLVPPKSSEDNESWWRLWLPV